jgi:hypothetical protein
MRLLAFAIAILVLAPLGDAHGDIFLQDNTVSFNYDTDGTGDFEFSYDTTGNQVNSLEAIEVWIRYRLTPDAANPNPVYIYEQLVADDANSSGSQVAFLSTPVRPGGGTNIGTLNPTLDFNLTETSPGKGNLDYDFTLAFSNFFGNDKIDLDGFVSFDLAGDGTDDDHGFISTLNLYSISSDTTDANLRSAPSPDVSGFDIFDRSTTVIAGDTSLFDSNNDVTPATTADLAFGHFFEFGTNLPTSNNQEITRSAFVSVPEPTSATLLVLGFAGLMFRRSRP